MVRGSRQKWNRILGKQERIQVEKKLKQLGTLILHEIVQTRPGSGTWMIWTLLPTGPAAPVTYVSHSAFLNIIFLN